MIGTLWCDFNRSNLENFLISKVNLDFISAIVPLNVSTSSLILKRLILASYLAGLTAAGKLNRFSNTFTVIFICRISFKLVAVSSAKRDLQNSSNDVHSGAMTGLKFRKSRGVVGFTASVHVWRLSQCGLTSAQR